MALITKESVDLLTTFMKIFKDVLNEFRINNSLFEEKNSSLSEYDDFFMRWKTDITNKHNGINLSMHWAKDSKTVNTNQVILNLTYLQSYEFEVKYSFGDTFVLMNPDTGRMVKAFVINIDVFIDYLKKVYNSFYNFNLMFDNLGEVPTSRYEDEFELWKKEIYDEYPGTTMDLVWQTDNPVASHNKISLFIMYKDDFICKISNLRDEIDGELLL